MGYKKLINSFEMKTRIDYLVIYWEFSFLNLLIVFRNVIMCSTSLIYLIFLKIFLLYPEVLKF